MARLSLPFDRTNTFNKLWNERWWDVFGTFIAFPANNRMSVMVRYLFGESNAIELNVKQIQSSWNIQRGSTSHKSDKNSPVAQLALLVHPRDIWKFTNMIFPSNVSIGVAGHHPASGIVFKVNEKKKLRHNEIWSDIESRLVTKAKHNKSCLSRKFEVVRRLSERRSQKSIHADPKDSAPCDSMWTATLKAQIESS